MNTLLNLMVPVIIQWTLLLCMAWPIHFMLRRRDARWRRMLWRGVLACLAGIVILPVLPMPLPRLHVRLGGPASPISELPETVAAAPAAAGISGGGSSPVSASPKTDAAALPAMPEPAPRDLKYPFTWGQTLLLTWAAIAAAGAIRQVVLHRRLAHVRKAATPAGGALSRDLHALQANLGARRRVELRISNSIASPLLCGLRRPTILIPAAMADDFSNGQRKVLLAHELAHLLSHDLFWYMAWRGMSTLLWFHPLVWGVPRAHEIACELEADRLAAGGDDDRPAYRQQLALLALRVLSISPPELRLGLGASSQIARRLEWLNHPQPGRWSRGASLRAATIVIVLFFLATGCEITPAAGVNPSAPMEYKKTLVTVQDEDGKPLSGATVTPNGFRVKGPHSPDAYGWNKKAFGEPVPATTDADGKAWVQYPVMGIPEEQELTGAIMFNVDHAGYSTTNFQEHYIDRTNKPIIMHHAATVDVAAWFGADRQPVTEFVANLSSSRPTDWEKGPAGHLINSRLLPGEHVLQLMGRLSSGQIVFSEGRVITTTREKPTTLSIEMKPGIRLEGRVDAGVARPVQNGHVFVSIRPPQFPVRPVLQDYAAPMEKYGQMNFWHTYRPINPDGTFVFEAVPPGEADITAVGDGFVSQSQGDYRNRMPDGSLEKENASDHGFVIPQAFPLAAPTTQITVATLPGATVLVTCKTSGGKPVEGADIFLNPNNVRMAGSGIFGTMANSSELPFKTLEPLPRPVYYTKTDKDGKATISNIPGNMTHLGLEHQDYQMPLQDPEGFRGRNFRVTFSPGQTTHLDLILERKWSTFIGVR